MARRVTNISLNGTKLLVEYNDCTQQEIDLCVDCSGNDEPPQDDPGPWPDPITDPATRCRVAIHVGEFAAERLNNFLSGLNLNTSAVNIFEAYAAAKLVEYGWDLNLWDDLVNFCISLYEGLSAGRGLAAKTQYDSNSTAVTTEVQEALYCALDETGNFTSLERDFWRIGLQNRVSEFYLVLSDFLLIWPLAQLRELAFTASANTETVDCSSFNCSLGGECEPGCTNVVSTVPYNSALWTMRGNYTRIKIATPVGQTDSFEAGPPCEITLPVPKCIVAVEAWHYQIGSTGGWATMRCYVDNDPFGTDAVVLSFAECGQYSPSGKPSARFLGNKLGQVIRFEPITTVGGGQGAMVCVKITACE